MPKHHHAYQNHHYVIMTFKVPLQSFHIWINHEDSLHYTKLIVGLI